MKKHINRNILWADLFVKQLAACGVRYVCISPGSRSTPLTFAFAENKNIKKYVLIDERSSAFFALGLAKSSNTPVAVVTTSGTAAAELYPAIIEAYYQRTPLIICTGDRPPKYYNCGANQTINQINLYKNHIRKYYNAGLPSISKSKLLKIKKTAADAFYLSMHDNRGPVHINFPFDKPFEPDSYTDKIDSKLLNDISSVNFNGLNNSKLSDIKIPEKIFQIIRNSDKGIIFCGPGEYDNSFISLLKKFSSKNNFPVFASALSSVRFSKNKFIVSNFDTFLRSAKFIQNFDPQIIIQFGAAPTTNPALEFFEKSKAKIILVNEFGDLMDPSKNAGTIINLKPESFIKEFFRKESLKSETKPKVDNKYFNTIKTIDENICEIRRREIFCAEFPFEGRIINEVISLLPDNSNLMISNSMPARDLEYFSEVSDKHIKVFSNRGASGIDGITSTALGIAASSKKQTVLITGDLSFYHDLNGLLGAKNYKVPLVIILINNNGGAIFDMLPISKYQNVFNDYFKTPHTINFSKIVEGYNGNFVNIKNWELFNTEFKKALSLTNFTVLQIKTDSSKSHLLRKKFSNESLLLTDSILNDN
ncbi:MAG: 2-succinyl-5-enolpyruvyl-6-hydroxy-3-cyclohexene-1-carboxylic-acid synthase [Bacteroidetes bacterium]|nr:2-succinyl-5-enolpyruvyl-6-hydroxy-3-cyclohexene-1-carboxylic-acid synthase [Bacteroidota bacterium]